ncbi:MAG: hypothetical protein ABIQ09_12710 [Jatrophihabitantaceae bacterium]
MSAAKGDRLWMAGGAVGGVVISALAWFMVVSPELSNASSLNEQTLSSQTQNVSLQSKIRRLQADNANMDALVGSLRQARAALPVESNLAEFTRQLSGYASQHGVSIGAITAGEPMALTSTAPAPAAGAATAAPAAPAAGSAPVTPPPVSVASADGRTYALPLTVVVKGAAANDLRFLAAIQGPGKRAALVTGAQLTGDNTKRGAAMQLTIQLQLYVTPQASNPVDDLLKRLSDAPK